MSTGNAIAERAIQAVQDNEPEVFMATSLEYQLFMALGGQPADVEVIDRLEAALEARVESERAERRVSDPAIDLAIASVEVPDNLGGLSL